MSYGWIEITWCPSCQTRVLDVPEGQICECDQD